MAILVLKFGGTSVADIACLQNVANKIHAEYQLGNKILVVVSAMAGVTNKLVEYCTELSALSTIDSLSEYDVALSSGEIVSAALLALSLQNLGIKSRSFQAWQIPIQTCSSFSKATLSNIDITIIQQCFDHFIIPIVSGFQGVSPDLRTTTLGRGGSDTTAAALAAALAADRCDIYTDVDGVYTSDPRMVTSARKLTHICYEEMLEFAALGAKVLHPRAVQLAMRYQIPIRVLSSFNSKLFSEQLFDQSGTTITSKDKIMETAQLTGVAYNHTIALITINGFQQYPHDFLPIYNYLIDHNATIDSLIQLYDAASNTHYVHFTVLLSDVNKVEKLLCEYGFNHLYTNIVINSDVVVISLIGQGIKADPQISIKMLTILAQHNLQIYCSHSNEIKLSIIVNDQQPELIIQHLHAVFIEGENHL